MAESPGTAVPGLSPTKPGPSREGPRVNGSAKASGQPSRRESAIPRVGLLRDSVAAPAAQGHLIALAVEAQPAGVGAHQEDASPLHAADAVGAQGFFQAGGIEAGALVADVDKDFRRRHQVADLHLLARVVAVA